MGVYGHWFECCRNVYFRTFAYNLVHIHLVSWKISNAKSYFSHHETIIRTGITCKTKSLVTCVTQHAGSVLLKVLKYFEVMPNNSLICKKLHNLDWLLQVSFYESTKHIFYYKKTKVVPASFSCFFRIFMKRKI